LLAGGTYRRAHGVFVGVDVPCHVNNVELISDALEPALETSTVIRGEDAVRSNILAQLENVVQAARREDLIIAYFSAHTHKAYGDLYLLPSDFDPEAPLATAVSFRLISAVLASKPDVRGLIILDAGNAAAVGFDMSGYQVGSELGLMVSCGPNEQSYATERGGGNVGDFTWHLVKVLNGTISKAAPGPWRLPLIDWFDKAAGRTEKSAGRRQHPVILGTLSASLELRSRRDGDATRHMS
jgi:hypothetical protein